MTTVLVKPINELCLNVEQLLDLSTLGTYALIAPYHQRPDDSLRILINTKTTESPLEK